ncbi:MAG: hypothetical protein H7066_05885 [Cytophagaceae bacterium]|nr:hypothetical protein [Gemmatimonadaceae bacterium]
MLRLTVRSVLLPACLALAPVSPLIAQGSASPFEAWIGCWDLVPRETFAASTSRVCVLPTGSPSAVDLVSVAGDSITSRQRLDASVEPREVRQGDCAGTERVQASGRRVYFRTSMKCGSEGRLVNSVMAMSSSGEWLDVRGVAFGTNVGVRASRYREAPSSAQLPAEVASALRGRTPGMNAARIAASGRVDLADVVEASRALEVGVLQTWLAERGQGFALDARQVVSLEQAGVAPSVIDIMVALSYPLQFALDRTRLGDPPPDVQGEVREVDGGVMYDDYGYGYDPYGYGYGRGGGWYSGRRPVVVVERSEANDEEHGKVVKGRGYVSGRDDSSRSGSDRSGDSSRGTAGSSGGSDKGSSTGRKAKPKP